jgi:hypothetical protein
MSLNPAQKFKSEFHENPGSEIKYICELEISRTSLMKMKYSWAIYWVSLFCLLPIISLSLGNRRNDAALGSVNFVEIDFATFRLPLDLAGVLAISPLKS